MPSFDKITAVLTGNRILFLGTLFLVTLLFRSPSMLIDYYDVDVLAAIIQTQEYMAGDIPHADFAISKKDLYHVPFRIAYKMSAEYGWVIVNFFGIIIVFLTSLFIYQTAKRVFSREAGIWAAFLYAILISSFNRHFMALNGEVVFNLPVAASLYFYVLFIQTAGKARFGHLAVSLLCGFMSYSIKFQGIIPLLVIPFHLVIYKPWYENRFSIKYFLSLTSLASAGLVIFMADYFFTGKFAPKIVSSVLGMAVYASGHGFNPAMYFGKIIHRNGFLFLWHFVLWAPAIIYFCSMARRRFRPETAAETAVIVFALGYYALIYASGQRIYFHYFMAVYPALAILSAGALLYHKSALMEQIRAKALVLLMIPAFFFLSWNYKDVIIRHFVPRAFYNEGIVLYWTRAVLVGTFDDYLLPGKAYINAAGRIKNLTKPGDRIFVWGNGPYLYYFSERRMGSHTLWPKGTIDRIAENYQKGTSESLASAHFYEQGLIDIMEKKKPVLFADTSGNDFAYFDTPVTPLVSEYVNKNFEYIETIDNIKLYLRKK